MNLKERTFGRSLGPRNWVWQRLGPNRFLCLSDLFGLGLLRVKPILNGLKGLCLRHFEGYPPFDFEFPNQMSGEWCRQEIMGGKFPRKNPRDSKLRATG